MDAKEFLSSKGQFRMDLGLHRIREVLKKLGNPQDSFISIHIAGTNGKGSVSCLLASALKKCGYTVGLFTSPHLVELNERIQVNGVPISDNELDKALSKIRPHLTDETYFEILTAAGFEYFRQRNVRFAVIEVGLGGRLDATNVITPEAAVITNISLEHMSHLGATIEEIAREKAGIVKQGVAVVTGAEGVAFNVIKKACSDKGASLFRPDHDGVELGMKGAYQHSNVMLAYKAIEILRKKHALDDSMVRAGFRDAYWPGRLDMVQDGLIFDCAHNPDGARVLAKELREMYPHGVDLVLGIMKDKNIPEMCKALSPVARRVIVIKPNVERAAEPDEIARHFTGAEIIRDIGEALRSANRPAVLTGSIFAVGEGFAAIGKKPF